MASTRGRNLDPIKRIGNQARIKHEMTGGGSACEWPTLTSPPSFGPLVKASFLAHVRSLDLSTIPFDLVSNFMLC